MNIDKWQLYVLISLMMSLIKNFLSKVKKMPSLVGTLNSTGTSSVGGEDDHVD